jgi:hypothetical protein
LLVMSQGVYDFSRSGKNKSMLILVHLS